MAKIKIGKVHEVIAIYPNGNRLWVRMKGEQTLPNVIAARDSETTTIAFSKEDGQKFAVVAPKTTITEDALSSVEEVVNDWFSQLAKNRSVTGVKETLFGVTADRGIFMAQPAGAEKKERDQTISKMKKWLATATNPAGANSDTTKNPPAGAEETTKNPPAGAEDTTKNPPAGTEGAAKNPPAGTPGKGAADFREALERIRNNRR